MLLNSKIIAIDCIAMCILYSDSVSGFAPSSISSSFTTRKTTSSSKLSTELQMGLEALSKEGSWTAYLDEDNTGLVYYFNTNTGESSWDPPTETFPKVDLPRRKKERMAAKQKEYNEKFPIYGQPSNDEKQDSNNEEGGFGGIFGALFGGNDQDSDASRSAAVSTLEEVKQIEEISQNAKEGTPLFKFFGSDEGSQTKTQSEVQSEVQSETKEAANGLNGAGGLPATSFFDSLFKQEEKVIEPVEEIVEEEVEEIATNNRVNGDSPASFLNNLFAPKVNGGNTALKDKSEEDFYDQTLFEDAKVAEEVVPEVQPIKLEFSSKVMPHPEKISWGGEDALFVSGKSFGVFDGVSGAEKLEGVPLYSNTLAQKMKASTGKGGLTIDEIKEKMLKAAEYADVAATGASTAVVASVGDDDILRAVNLGDSVLMVIRDGAVKARVKETVHYFDCPYQLSDDSPDRPKKGSVLETPLQKGDIMIAGSDGVFDNISDSFLLEIVQKNSKGSVSKMVQEIVSESRKISKDTNAVTPYAKQAKRNNYAAYSKGVGGKIDDISCIVARCK